MRWAPALLTVSSVQLAPSGERPAASQPVLPSAAATKPSSETDILRTSEAIRCFLPGRAGSGGTRYDASRRRLRRVRTRAWLRCEHDLVTGFAGAERALADRLSSLRNTVRQELIARQLDEHVADGLSVLDVGCGQGTQAIRLARRGCRVVGVDRSSELLARLHADAATAGVAIETVKTDLDALEPSLGSRTFDVVCAHGLLMYLDDDRAAFTRLAERVNSHGLLSMTFRNS